MLPRTNIRDNSNNKQSMTFALLLLMYCELSLCVSEYFVGCVSIMVIYTFINKHAFQQLMFAGVLSVYKNQNHQVLI